MNNLNFRKCIVSNKIRSKSELIRIVKTNNNEFFINTNQKGRGAYISKDFNDYELILKKRVLNKSFRINVPTEVYEQLIKILKEINNGR